MDVADGYDQATFELCCAVYHHDFTQFDDDVRKLFDRPLTSANLLVIDYIAVHQRFRGQGIGRIAMSKIIDAHKGKASLVALEAIPLQQGFQPYSVSMEPGQPFSIDFSDLDPDEKNSRAKLRRLFSDMGFVRLGKTDYMAKGFA